MLSERSPGLANASRSTPIPEPNSLVTMGSFDSSLPVQRVFVHRSIAGQFVERLKASTEATWNLAIPMNAARVDFIAH